MGVALEDVLAEENAELRAINRDLLAALQLALSALVTSFEPTDGVRKAREAARAAIAKATGE